MELTQTLKDPAGIVTKLVFEAPGAVAEAVVYNYACRSVVCFSVQAGCPVGCSFCGTGKKFLRNLTAEEIEFQIQTALNILPLVDRKPQLMAMSMGEPMLNWPEAGKVVEAFLQEDFPVYVSTVGVAATAGEVIPEFFRLGLFYPTFGLQWSMHHWDPEQRQSLLGNYPLMPMWAMLQHLREWTFVCKRPAYCNYICAGRETVEDALNVRAMTSGLHLTCSVLSPLSLGRPAKLGAAERFMKMVAECPSPYDIPEMSMFDPAGQDTIGGGCGQLLYVQQRLGVQSGS